METLVNTTTELRKENLETRSDKRKFLSGISKLIQPLVKEGVYETVNEGLKEMYLEDLPEGTTFNTFKGWRKEGKQVKKGEKAFFIWGRPRNIDKKEPVKEGEKDEFEFFPLAYLFSSEQVQNV
jgi:hypothetical protein